MRILSFDLRCLDIEVGKLHYTGGERQFFEITKHWARLGHEVHIVGSKYTQFLVETFNSEAIIHTWEPLRPPPKSVVELLNIKRMMKKVPKAHFDFIYCPYELFEWVFASILLKNKLKIPLVTSVNLFEPNEVSTFPFYMLRYRLFLRNLFLKRSDVIFCVSSMIKRLLMKIGIEKNRLYVVGSGINLDDVKSVEASKKIFDACFMGDIIPRKGILDLILAWKRVTNHLKDAKLLIM